MISAVILEDEVPAAERLELLLQDCAVLTLARFTRAETALNWFRTHSADVIFVDIGLPETNGVAFVERLSHVARAPLPSVIFITAYEEYAVRAFDLAAVDYLLKPVKVTRLREALTRIPGYRERHDEKLDFAVTRDGERQKIPWQRAAYLHADQKIVWLHTFEGEVYELPNSLVYWEELFGDRVVRVYRNIVVMRHAMKSLVPLDEGDTEDEDNMRFGVQLIDSDEILPVSRRQLRVLKKELGY